MTLAESRVRRAWVGFSALAFAICGVLLLVQFSGKLNRPNESRPASPAPPIAQPESSPPPSPTSPAPPAPPPLVEPQKPIVAPDHDDGSAGSSKPGLPRTGTRPGSKAPPAKAPSQPEGRGGNFMTGGVPAPQVGGFGTQTGAELRRPTAPPAAPSTKDTSLATKKGPAPDTKDGKASRHADTQPETEATPSVQAAVPPPPPAPPELSEGILKVNVPPTMLVGQSEHVRAVVGKKIHVAQVDKEAALETNDGARVQIGRDLMISTLVRMDLRGDSAGEFDITALAPDATQHISDNDATVWEWAVTPKQEGMHGLTLVVSDLKENSREIIRSKIYPVHIDVRVTAWQRVREVTVAGSTMLSGLAGLIGAWLGLLRPLLQRRTPGGGDGGGGGASPRGQGYAGAAPPPATHGAAPVGGAAPLATAPPAARSPAALAAVAPAVAPASTLAAGSAADALSLDVAAAAAPPVAAVLPVVTAAAAPAAPSAPTPAADKPATS